MTTYQRNYHPAFDLLTLFGRLLLIVGWFWLAAFAVVAVISYPVPSVLVISGILGVLYARYRYRKWLNSLCIAQIRAAKAEFYRQQAAERAERHPDLVFEDHKTAWEKELAA